MTAVYDGLCFTAISSEINDCSRDPCLGLQALRHWHCPRHFKGGPIGYCNPIAGGVAGALLAGLLTPTLRRTLTQGCLVVPSCVARDEISLALTSSLAIATICLAIGGAG